VVDLLRAVAIVFALVASARARSWVGVACSVALAYVAAADLASLVASTDRAPHGAHAAFAAVFLGPSGLPGRAEGWLPLSGVVGAHPAIVRAATLVASAATFAIAHLRSSKLRPETHAAYRADAMARPFLGIALIDASQIVLAVLGRAMFE
jgi:hypothetical protein